MSIKKVLFGVMLCATVFVSCKKEKTPAPAQPTTPVVTHQFLSQTTDPYSGPVPVGGRTYVFLKAPISPNNSYNYYPVYANRSNGSQYSDAGNIYYNPVLKHDSIVFGSSVLANSAEFRAKANAVVQGSGYVLISSSSDGGAAYKTYDVILLSGNVVIN